MTAPVSTKEYPQGNITRRIADFIVIEREKPLSRATREYAFNCLLDALGCAAAGIDDDAAVPIRLAIQTTRPEGDVPIWFTGKTSSVIGAATANSAAAVAIDLDDVDPAAVSHWGAAAISTALAISAPWERKLTAIAIGISVGHFVGVARERQKYVNAGVIVPSVVVAVDAALRGTSRDEIEHALAIGLEWAPSQRFMSRRSDRPRPDLGLVKEGIPHGVATGLDAAAYAENGLTGSRNILDCLTYFNFTDLDLKIEDIGTTCFKPYACCRHIHAPLAAMEELIAEHNIKADEIDKILVETNFYGATLPNKTAPKNLVELVYSIPYSLALVAIDGRPALLPLIPAALGRQDVTALAEKVKVTHDTKMLQTDPMTGDTLARVTIVVRGNSFSSGVTAPEGGGNRPSSYEDLVEKFRKATRFVATQEQQDQLLKAIERARTGDPTALEKCLGTIVLSKINKISRRR